MSPPPKRPAPEGTAGPLMAGPASATRSAEELLADSERKYRQLIQDAADVIYIHAQDGRFREVNQAACDLYGYSMQEILQMSVRDIVDPTDLPRAAAAMAQKADGRMDRTGPYELLTRTRTGGKVWLEVTTRIMRDGGEMVIQGIGRDITGRKRAEAALGLLDDLTREVEGAGTMEAALGIVVAKLGEAGGWAYAEAWVPDGDTLRPAEGWLGTRDGAPRFRKLTEKMRLGPGEDLAGRAWASRRPEWVPELRMDAAMPRAAAAAAAGLHAGAAIPMLAGGEVVAILVFLDTQARADAQRWLDVGDKAARHVGTLVARRHATEAWRTQAVRLGAQFALLPFPALLVAGDGTPIEANEEFLALCGTASRPDAPELAPLPKRVADLRRFQDVLQSLYGPQGRIQHQGRTYTRLNQDLRHGGELLGRALYLLP